MRLTRVTLQLSAIGSVGYAIGLAFFPDFLADLDSGPAETAWVRYLIPVYLGLGVIAWAASRDPHAHALVGWGIAVLWIGLALSHIVNMLAGDEPVAASTVGFLVFDSAMAVALSVGLVQMRRDVGTLSRET